MRREYKEKIRQAFIDETPDFSAQIEKACENETQYASSLTDSGRRPWFASVAFRRTVTALVCAAVFGVGLCVGHILKPDVTPDPTPTPTMNARVYLDAEPSIELDIDSNGKVLGYTATNNDGAVVLKNVDLQGVDMQTAVNTIVNRLQENGYFGVEQNSMLISVDTVNDSESEGVLSSVKNQVSRAFAESNVSCSIIAQSVETDEDLQRRAEEQGISVGKMALVDKLMGSLDSVETLYPAELASLSIKQLNLIYSMRPNRNERPWEDLVSGAVNGYVSETDAVMAVLEKMNVAFSTVENYSLFVMPMPRYSKSLVYAVTIKLLEDDIVYKYDVDCITGEVMEGMKNDGNVAPFPPNTLSPWRMIRGAV